MLSLKFVWHGLIVASIAVLELPPTTSTARDGKQCGWMYLRERERDRQTERERGLERGCQEAERQTTHPQPIARPSFKSRIFHVRTVQPNKATQHFRSSLSYFTEAILEQPCKNGVSVRHKGGFFGRLALPLRQGIDHKTERGERFVDVGTFLQSVTSGTSL